MAQKKESFLDNLAKQKRTIKTNQWEIFNFLFSYGKLKDSSLTYFPGFAVLCLEHVENIGQMHKSTFPFETSLMTSSI